MKRLLIVACLVGGWAFVPCEAGEGLAGRWRLTEQYYNHGGHNFADGAPEFVLVFERRGEEFAGSVRFLGWTAPWPVWVTDDSPAPLGERTVRVTADGIASEYRVLPAPGDSTTLVVNETCRPDGSVRMRCEVAVAFERDGAPAGGFTWRRVFVREDAR